MTDVPLAVVVSEAERQSSSERISMEVHRALADEMGTGFRKELKDLLTRRGLERDIGLADLMGKFARSLDLFMKDGVYLDWEERLRDTIFGPGESSVVNCLGRFRANEVRNQLLGPISILTFADLIRKVVPEAGEINLSQIVTLGNIDVENKVDLILRGAKGTSLIQLKTVRDKKGTVYAAEVDPENVIPNGYFGLVKRKDAEKMLEVRQWLIDDNPGANVRVFVVLVPPYDSPAVENIYGIIRDNYPGDEAIRSFSQANEELNFLPF